jgi:hypothetical protein
MITFRPGMVLSLALGLLLTPSTSEAAPKKKKSSGGGHTISGLVEHVHIQRDREGHVTLKVHHKGKSTAGKGKPAGKKKGTASLDTAKLGELLAVKGPFVAAGKGKPQAKPAAGKAKGKGSEGINIRVNHHTKVFKHGKEVGLKALHSGEHITAHMHNGVAHKIHIESHRGKAAVKGKGKAAKKNKK